LNEKVLPAVVGYKITKKSPKFDGKGRSFKDSVF
jgi:hypothetical protein